MQRGREHPFPCRPHSLQCVSGTHWPSWPPEPTLLATRAHCWLMVRHWSTVHLLLSNHWSTRTPLAFLASRAHCWLVLNYWSAVGQPLVSQDTIGPLGHQNTLLARGQPLVNPWSTVVQPLVNQNTIGLLGHQSPLLARGQPLVNPWSTVVRPLVNQNTIGPLGHQSPLLARGQPLVNHCPPVPPGPSPRSSFPAAGAPQRPNPSLVSHDGKDSQLPVSCLSGS